MKRIVAPLLFIVAVSLATDAQQPASRMTVEDAGRAPWEVSAVVLHDTERSGSLVYGWKCVGPGLSDPFKVTVPQQEGSAVQRLSAAFAKYPSFKVGEDKNGLIRVFGEGASTDLLRLRIKQVVFHREADPMRALSTILSAPEISAYMREHHIEDISQGTGIYPSPSQTSPRLDGTKENLTLYEALDLLPLTYTGMWGYQECEGAGGKRTVAFGFWQWSQPRVR